MVPQNTNGVRLVTYTGRAVDIFNFKPTDYSIEDIAHALSLQTRYGGHCTGFYSVAEHCVLLVEYIAREFPNDIELQRWALMHDAPEAYIGDLPAPIKVFMPFFQEIENKIMAVICTHLGMGPMPDSFAAIDVRIRGDEVAQNHPRPVTYDIGAPLGVTLEFMMPVIAEQRFLLHYHRLFTVSA